MSLKYNSKSPYTKRRGVQKDTEEGHVKMEVKIGGMYPQARNARGSETGGGKKPFSRATTSGLHSYEGTHFCFQTLS